MRLLYFNPDRGIPVLGDKGASVHVRAFVAAARNLGHEVALVCATRGEGNPPPDALVIELAPDIAPAALEALAAERGVGPAFLADPVARRELARIAHDRILAHAVPAALARAGFRPQIMYERHALFHSSGVAIARALDLPRVLEVNAPLIAEQRRFRGLVFEDAARAAEAASYRGADAILAVSEAVAAQIRPVLGAADATRVRVVPNGVDTQRFRPGAGRKEMRGRLGLGDAPTIGFFGSFKPWHGVDLLLETFRALAAIRPEARLIAVGEGPEHAAFRDGIAASRLRERTILPGRVPHAAIPAWLAACDLTIAPYMPQPGFYFSPLKVVESLAAGRPVVAPALGQIPDLIEDGRNGRLYRPGDS
ncbi:MAG: glycosyltransferase, partial [Rhodospirillales bacterium]|nr:glycosyltransferase [Rhodospirillales bacterium]